MQRTKVLYFIEGVLPGKDLIEKAFKSNYQVSFRNANFHSEEDKAEECDMVAGEFPETYKDKKVFKFESETAKVVK
jgi:hypothetical protein